MRRPFLGIASNSLSFKLSTSSDIALSAPNLDLGPSSFLEVSTAGVEGVVNPDAVAA